jgi:UDP-N-acetyl-D-galactosamine dehydrogenase
VISPTIAIIGLGYVGLPLAVALAERYSVIGLDIDQGRIDELGQGHDRTREIEPERLSASRLKLTSAPDDCRGADLFIVTVPTPVDSANRPDLRPLLSATRTVAGLLEAGRMATIVYESTVYPGVTDDICAPELERNSGLKRGQHFRLSLRPLLGRSAQDALTVVSALRQLQQAIPRQIPVRSFAGIG